MKYLFFLLLFLLIFYIDKSYESTDKITFIDIQDKDDDYGDAIVIQSTNSKGEPIYAMVDTGRDIVASLSTVLGYLKRNNITTLEWILLSHFHLDHWGGLTKIIEDPNITIKDIYAKKFQNLISHWVPDGQTIEEFRKERSQEWNKYMDLINTHNIPIHFLNDNTIKELSLGNYEFKLLNVEEVFTEFNNYCSKNKGCNENSNSVIAVGKNKNRYYLLNGDIDSYPFKNSKNAAYKEAYERNRVDQWVKKAKKLYNIDHFDVYKVSHHGAPGNNPLESFIEAKPDILVTTKKREGTQDVNNLLNKIKKANKNAKTYFSGNGTVTISQDEKGNIKVVQEKDEHAIQEFNIKNVKEQWIYNVATNKCLFAPSTFNNRPQLGDCNDSDYAKWYVSSSDRGLLLRSKVNPDWCASVSNTRDGKIIMNNCNYLSYLEYGDPKTHKINTIRSAMPYDLCLDILNSKEINSSSFKLNMNKCTEGNTLQQSWSFWNVNPADVKTVKIYIKNTDKCLRSPVNYNNRPLLGTCNDTNRSNWLISSSSKGYVRSVAYPDWCINFKDLKAGTITGIQCDDNAIFNYPTNSDDTIKSPLDNNKCLGYLEEDINNEIPRLNLNKCDKNKNDQHWEIVTIDQPKIINDKIDDVETRTVWVYNKKLKKCLVSGTQYNNRPIIRDCDNTETSTWEIPVSGDLFFKSSEYGWCIFNSVPSIGGLNMRECSGESISMKDPSSSPTKEAIRPYYDDNLCLGILNSGSATETRLNMNPCDKSKDDQSWEIWDRNPVDMTPKETRRVWVYNRKLNKCLFSGTKYNNRPIIRDCDNTNSAKWDVSISVSGGLYFKSVEYGWCIYNSEPTIGGLNMRDCNDANIIMKDISTSPTKEALRPYYDDNLCLGILNSGSATETRLNMNPCDESKDDQSWEIWDQNPAASIKEDKVETRRVWVYNKKMNKCLFSGTQYNNRPIIGDCDNTNSSKWDIPVSGELYFKSVEYGWCIYNSEPTVGGLNMRECDNDKVIMKDIFSSPTREAIRPYYDENLCMGKLYPDNKNDIRLNMNPCDKSKEDQSWEIWDRNPNDIIEAKTKTVWVYNEKLNKCLKSGTQFNNRPILGDCDNTNSSKWEIPVSGDPFFKSVEYGWCIYNSEPTIGGLNMRDCNSFNIIMRNPSSSASTRKDIRPLYDENLCMGKLYIDNKNDIRLNMNPCDDKMNDQYWEIRTSNPVSTGTTTRTTTRTVYVTKTK